MSRAGVRSRKPKPENRQRSPTQWWARTPDETIAHRREQISLEKQMPWYRLVTATASMDSSIAYLLDTEPDCTDISLSKRRWSEANFAWKYNCEDPVDAPPWKGGGAMTVSQLRPPYWRSPAPARLRPAAVLIW